MSEMVFFLEEPSAQALLEKLLPRLITSNKRLRYVVFEGKQDLEKQIVRRIRGYKVPGARFIVLRDQDASDCIKIKKNLLKKCGEAGRQDAIVRIACHELESWYLADLAAVEKGLGITGISSLQNKKIYRTPDNYPAPSKILSQIVPKYQKISGSRAIGEHLLLDNKRSPSFYHFVNAILHIDKA